MVKDSFLLSSKLIIQDLVCLKLQEKKNVAVIYAALCLENKLGISVYSLLTIQPTPGERLECVRNIY